MLKDSLQLAFDEASSEYENGHLKGDQIKDFITKAMALVDTESAMLMQGTKTTTGTFKIKEFPLNKLGVITEPVFQNVSADAPVVETDSDTLGEDGDEDIRTPFDAVGFVSMSPKAALEMYGIETIEQLIINFKVEIKDGLNETQKTAALITALKKMK
jgi:hypothetical protein